MKFYCRFLVRDLGRLVKAVIDFNHGVALRVRLFNHIIMLVVFVCLDAAVFIGVFDQQAVAVILAGALLAVSVCRDPLVFFISEDGF